MFKDGDDNGDYNGEDDVFTNQICKFKMLTSLGTEHYPFAMNEFRKMATHLQRLTEPSAKIPKTKSIEKTESKINSVLSLFPNLKQFSVLLPKSCCKKQFFHVYKAHQLVYEFYVRFTSQFPNTTLNIGDDVMAGNGILSISRDRIYIFDDKTDELHWMENFNEKSIRNTMKEAVGICDHPENFKFINNCSDNLDVSMLSNECTSKTISLEVKSKGSISVNKVVSVNNSISLNIYKRTFVILLQASSRPSFFPKLKTIKVELENHTAIDFLRDLSPDFCPQIEELKIKTKMINDVEKDEYENGMTRILGKFENLVCEN